MKFQSCDQIRTTILDEGPVTENWMNYNITFGGIFSRQCIEEGKKHRRNHLFKP